MIRFQIACNDARPTFGERCPTLDPPPGLTLKDGAAWVEAALEENGWTTVGDRHLCPLHNPAEKGTEVTVHEAAYTQIAPGVNARLPVGSGISDLVIEVQHYEPSEGTAVPRQGKPPWLAKPPLIPGT